MKFELVTIGKFNNKFIYDGIIEYYKRINRYVDLNWLALKGETIVPKVNDGLIKDKEGKRVLAKVSKDGLWVALDRKGQEMSSEQHFAFLNSQIKKGIKRIYYLIGGPLGWSEEVLARADRILSLSRMTLPHELAALFLLEQIYRYVNFMAGEKYHK